MLTQKQLAIILTQFSEFAKPSASLEQYKTNPDIAAEILWSAKMNGDIEGKTIADLGCGTGILGISAILLGAKKVFFVDVDESALMLAKKNLEFVKNRYQLKNLKNRAEFILSDIVPFNEKVDVVLQNPPFGVQKEHADRKFLSKAFQIADVVYSFHKTESQIFLDQFSEDNGFKITRYFEFDFPLPKTQKFHTHKTYKFRVGCWRFERIKQS